jgi:5-methylcytosine-specific restriction protein A
MPTITKLKDIKRKTNNNIIQSAKYYNSKSWYVLRNSYIHYHPLCELCLKDNKVTAAEEIHHIKPFMTGVTEEQRWSLLLDKNNLMSLCKECHINIHKKMRISH